MNNTMIKFSSGLLLLLLAVNARAVPIEFAFTGTWDESTGTFGPSYDIRLTFDNGGSAVANQTFDQADFLSATISSGSYYETILPAEITAWYDDFLSNASGQLYAGGFNADPLAGGQTYLWLNISLYSAALDGYGNSRFNSASAVGRIAAVPEPATLALFGLGLAGLGAVRRKKRAA